MKIPSHIKGFIIYVTVVSTIAGAYTYYQHHVGWKENIKWFFANIWFNHSLAFLICFIGGLLYLNYRDKRIEKAKEKLRNQDEFYTVISTKIKDSTKFKNG